MRNVLFFVASLLLLGACSGEPRVTAVNVGFANGKGALSAGRAGTLLLSLNEDEALSPESVECAEGALKARKPFVVPTARAQGMCRACALGDAENHVAVPVRVPNDVSPGSHACTLVIGVDGKQKRVGFQVAVK